MHQVKSQPVMNPGLYIFRGDHKTKQSSVQMFPFLIRQRPAHGTNHFTAIDGVIVRGCFVVFSLNYGDNHFRAAAATRVKRCLDAFRGALGTDRGPGGLAVTSRLCNAPLPLPPRPPAWLGTLFDHLPTPLLSLSASSVLTWLTSGQPGKVT